MWHVYTKEQYLAIKNKIMSFAGKGMRLEIIMLGKINPDSERPIFSAMKNLSIYLSAYLFF
jgi:hypothetical protein